MVFPLMSSWLMTILLIASIFFIALSLILLKIIKNRNIKGRITNRFFPIVLRIIFVINIITIMIPLVVKISSTPVRNDSQIAESIDYIVNAIMESEIAGFIGKSEAEIEAVYGPKQNEGAWYNGLLYTQHKNFSGDFGYGNADPAAVTESIESDSICNVIVFKLSEIMPISDIVINKDELEFIYDDSEGDYFYILKYIDAPIRIDCDESGNIGQDPLIFIYLRT